MHDCTDIAGADKSTIQPIDPLWATASLHTGFLSHSHYPRQLQYRMTYYTPHEIHSYWYRTFQTPWWGNNQDSFFSPPSTPVLWLCTCFAPASCLSPSWWCHSWWVPVFQTASKTADTFSTCRHHLSGSEEQAWRRSARGMQTNCATPRCMTAVATSPSTQLTSLRSLMGRGGWTHPGCMSLRYRQQHCLLLGLREADWLCGQ